MKKLSFALAIFASTFVLSACAAKKPHCEDCASDKKAHCECCGKSKADCKCSGEKTKVAPETKKK